MQVLSVMVAASVGTDGSVSKGTRKFKASVQVVKSMVLNITLVGKHLRGSGANYCLACEVPLER